MGPDATARIDAFVAIKAERFWKRDALAEAADDLPLSDHDMRLVAAFGGLLLDQPMQAVSPFVDAELLRADLARGALRLPPSAVKRLEKGSERAPPDPVPGLACGRSGEMADMRLRFGQNRKTGPSGQ